MGAEDGALSFVFEEVVTVKIIAVTGHRPPKLGLRYGVAAENLHIYKPMVDLLNSQEEEILVLTGMALGIDQLMADACIDTCTEFTACIPFVGQEGRWPAASRDYYQRTLDHARKVIVVSDGGYDPVKMQRRNEWMVDHAAELWSWWDGSPGGTANCVAYAERQGVPVIDRRP